MTRKVFKYGTGQEVPAGGQYLTTIVEVTGHGERFVWHYFLVADPPEPKATYRGEPITNYNEVPLFE